MGRPNRRRIPHGDGRHVFTYGEATAIDAGGEEGLEILPGEGRTRDDAGCGVSRRRPVPLTIDPLLGSNFTVDYTGYDCRKVDVAYSPAAGSYLVAFEVTYGPNDLDIYCQAVTADGTVSGSMPQHRTRRFVRRSCVALRHQSVPCRVARESGGNYITVGQLLTVTTTSSPSTVPRSLSTPMPTRTRTSDSAIRRESASIWWLGIRRSARRATFSPGRWTSTGASAPPPRSPRSPTRPRQR